MSLLLNEEQQFLKDTAKEFLQKNAPISHFRDLRDSKAVSYTHLRAHET